LLGARRRSGPSTHLTNRLTIQHLSPPLKIDPTHLHVLQILITHIHDLNAPWAITGSLGFALQGLPVTPHDIDLQTDETGAYEIERRLAPYITQPVAFSTSERIRSHFGKLTIDGIPVEIMGAIQKRLPDGTWEPPVDIAQHRRFVEVEGMRLPVLSLTYEYQAYLTLGRLEKAEMLRRWLQNHGST
jgi:hypothetical protein